MPKIVKLCPMAGSYFFGLILKFKSDDYEFRFGIGLGKSIQKLKKNQSSTIFL